MIVGLLGVIASLLLLNIAYYEYRYQKPTKELDLIKRYAALQLLRRYK